ncbi:hypothetical protein [Bacillus suaedaesalsae]|uniref:AI-2E family transporter n=1 Tax=Bacillus suaedaesalsae TaxID=2810349 RepID=A0ABS2DH65_9BACI|nr:hypothetical protein [Bacillus suaedaesalsae]MBM6617825.1 hypothetical protein [Bacillus suaedaesalsae]
MKRMNKKFIVSTIIIVLVIAGLLDLKFEGLIYQLLPKAVQSFLGEIF